MCMKLISEDLNPGPWCGSHSISVNACGVTTTPRVRDSDEI